MAVQGMAERLFLAMRLLDARLARAVQLRCREIGAEMDLDDLTRRIAALEEWRCRVEETARLGSLIDVVVSAGPAGPGTMMKPHLVKPESE